MKVFGWFTLLLATSLSGQGFITNPLPPVASSGVDIRVREWASMPATAQTRPFARINELKPFSETNGWLGVNDLRGPLYMVDVRGNVRLYLNLAQTFNAFRDSPGLGTGLTSFAAHPDFERNGKFYTAHTEAGGAGTATMPLPLAAGALLQGVIIEWTAADPGAIPFAGSRRELMRVDLNGTIHGFQQIAFRRGIARDHPDFGKLFICLGDAQTMQRGPLGNIGTPASPLGTVMRIDPLATGPDHDRYGIPADNPFYGEADKVQEIWAYGFRNPHRITWDNERDHLLLADIGERNIEELNIIVPGGNYGWPFREGPYRLVPTGNTDVLWPLPADDSGYLYPVAMYDHGDGVAIAGGVIYRGNRLPALNGFYLASDIRHGKLFKVAADQLRLGEVAPFLQWFLSNSRGRINPYTMVGSSSRTDLRIGYDFHGEVYILTKQDGKIRKLVHPDEPEAGYGMLEGYAWNNFWLDTGDFLGWLNVAHAPWVFSHQLGKYIHIPPANADSGWIFVPSANR